MSDEQFIHPYGPLVYKTKISDEFHQYLIDGLDKSRDASDAGDTLIGNIDVQRRGEAYPPKEFHKFLDPIFLRYLQGRAYSHNERVKFVSPGEYYDEPPDVSKLEVEYNLGPGPWVNFQKPGEFNPMHNHSGIVSGIIFIDIPDEISTERKEFHSGAAGCLEFIHGDQHFLIRPKSQYLYMFPAHLWHMVYPFSTEGIERISMSFNVMYAKVNGSDLPQSDHFVNY
tara:strand:+ start:188 stop:865 length:678 start_codon:yes stop_codon:yes gene_type:complete